MFNKCKHDYELIYKTILESGYEQMAKNGEHIKSLNGPEAPSFFRKKLILIFKCPHCKKIKIEKSSNP